MPTLQPFVPNASLQVAKNLRFANDNGIPVTEMLAIGMNGNVVADSPTTGYISRIGAILSNQIDLYAQVSSTLSTYGQDIITLQERVTAFEISGTTIPVVNGHCFTGDANSPITTVVDLMATSVCDYIDVLGTTSALMEGILAEGASTLNVLAAFSQVSAMAGLSGWISDPETIADSINNLWLSYLDSRAGLSKALAAITPTCSQVLIDFMADYRTFSGTASGFYIYLSGYSFIPSGYTDNGSTLTITDGAGGVYTTGINVVTRSVAGADPLFVGISGTPLSTTASLYTVTLNSTIVSANNSCSKIVIKDALMHDANSGGGTGTDGYDTGLYVSGVISGTTSINVVTGLTYTPSFVSIQAADSATASIINSKILYVEYTQGGATLHLSSLLNSGTISLSWIAFKPPSS